MTGQTEQSTDACHLCDHDPACGHARNADGGRLCHTDDHSCYHQWTVYGRRRDPADEFWMVRLPQPSYEEECAGITRRIRLRQQVRDADPSVPDDVAQDMFLVDPEADDPMPEDRLYR